MNKLKRILIIALFVLFIGGLKCYAVSGKITDNSVRLRREPSTNCETIELLYKDNEVEVSEQIGDFYKVKIKGYSGYVHKDYVSLDGTLGNQTQTNQENTNKPQENANQIDNNTTNDNQPQENQDNNNQPQENQDNKQNQSQELKIEDIKTVSKEEPIYIIPVINSSKIDTVNTSSKLTVKQIINEWIYVSYENGYGWIRKEKLIDIPVAPVVATPEPPKTLNKVAYIRHDGVNFRKKPELTADIIKTLYINTKITLIEDVDSKWYKIDVNGTKGYISKDLVSENKVETTSRSSSTQQREPAVTTQPQVATANETANNAQTQEQTTSVTNKGQQIADMAKSHVGKKYVYGGTGPSSFDCSGLTMYVYKQFGISLPHSATSQSNYGRKISKSELQPGDLVFFSDYITYKGIGHIGIYIGNGSFVHASTPSTGVIISSINGDYYSKRYVTARRLVD